MTLFTEHSYSRVMVFIDFRNIYEVTTVKGLPPMDFYRLTQILVNNRDLVGAYVFDATPNSDPKDPTNVMHNKLKEQGFRVMARDSIVFRDEKPVQKEVDVSLACEMLEHALMNHFDVAIVVSGDRDFVPAMQKVQAAGKRVEVASFDDTYHVECKRTADVYYSLDKMPVLIMRSPDMRNQVEY